MANQVEPGTMGGAAEGSGDAGGTAQSAASGYGVAAGTGGPAGAAVAGQAGQAGLADSSAGVHQASHGRPVSWVAVSLIMAGFVTGGLALVFGPVWVVFWIGAGLAVVGSLLAAATNIFEDWY